MKKIYCDIRDKYISSKSSHKKTKTHKLLSISVVNRFYIKNIQVETIDSVVNEQIVDYNKKLLNFRGYVEIRKDNFCTKMDLGWLDLPFIVISDETIKRYKCNKKELVDLKNMFVTDLEHQSYHY